MYFDAGGGHRAAANALDAVIRNQNRPWQVRLVNVQELLDEVDLLRRFTGMRIQDGYNLLLKRGWTLGTDHLLRLLHALIRLGHNDQVRLLREFLGQDMPDMVVSLIPNFNRALFEAYQSVRPGAPYVTILTDLADCPPHFWLEKQDQYVICGTERASEQVRKYGIRPEAIFRVSGMILRPCFYEPMEMDRAGERRRLGLDAAAPTGLVLFGGQGSGAMVRILHDLQRVKQDLQLICICGRNEKLVERLRATPSRFPVFVEGFTERIPYYMRLADFFIGKPGPGSISEAVMMNLPVIVERNAWTMPQERFNTDWILENQVGIVVPSFHRIGEAVERLLAGDHLDQLRANARRIENRAVFEILEILTASLAPPAA
jgi:1,2-diacylglycerol 3-beta-galactosyltransferase